MKTVEVIKSIGQVASQAEIAHAILDAECDLRIEIGRDLFNAAYEADQVYREVFALSSQMYARAATEVDDGS